MYKAKIKTRKNLGKYSSCIYMYHFVVIVEKMYDHIPLKENIKTETFIVLTLNKAKNYSDFCIKIVRIKIY